MRVCVYHRTMGGEIRREVARECPGVEVELVRDTAADPPGRDGIDVLVANTFPPGLLGRCPRLRWLHLTGAGVDHVPAGRPRPGLIVTHSGDVPARAVAEFVWMGLLALAKDAPRLVAQQRAHQWRLPDSRLLSGSRLALVGLGRIGAEIARRAACFGVTVTAVTRSGRPSSLASQVLPSRRLLEALPLADHLVLAAPATPETRGLVDERALQALRAGATLINVGRASILDVPAVVRALRDGRLRAALLDVHDEEPLPPDSPLWDVENLWITPHGAYRFPEEERDVARLFARNLRALLEGGEMRNRVDIGGRLAGAAAGTVVAP
jgi:phosphoglycerate dehydrogenase-like enzyme